MSDDFRSTEGFGEPSAIQPSCIGRPTVLHQPSSRLASAVCPEVLHQLCSGPALAVQQSFISRSVVLHQLSVQRSCISHPAVLHRPSSSPAPAIQPSCISHPAVLHQPYSCPALAVQQSCISCPAILHQPSIQQSCKPFLPWAPLRHFSSPTSSSHLSQDPLSCPDV